MYKMYNQTIHKLYTWLKEINTSRDVAAPHTYMRGWYDCVNDVLRKIEEFETEERISHQGSLERNNIKKDESKITLESGATIELTTDSSEKFKGIDKAAIKESLTTEKREL